MGDIVSIRKYRTDGMSQKAVREYFENVLTEQGWKSEDVQDNLRYLSKKMSNGSSYGFTVSKDCHKAIDDIEITYRAYQKETRESLLKTVEKGIKVMDAALESSTIFNSLRRLRNAFLPHEMATPEWVKDFLSYAHTLGIETMCIKDEDGYMVLCCLPYLDYAMDFKGETPEEMALCVDYKIDAFSDTEFYKHSIQENPKLDDFKTLSRAKMIKQKLQQFREVIAENFLNESETY